MIQIHLFLPTPQKPKHLDFEIIKEHMNVNKSSPLTNLFSYPRFGSIGAAWGAFCSPHRANEKTPFSSRLFRNAWVSPAREI